MSTVSKNQFYIIANICINISHACNFFFYVLINKPFRTLLWRKVSKATHTDGTRMSTLRSENFKLRKLATDTHAIISLLQHRAEYLPTEQVTEYDDKLNTD